MEREYMKISWDQFEIIKGIVKKIQESITDFDDITIMKDSVQITANQQELVITIENE